MGDMTGQRSLRTLDPVAARQHGAISRRQLTRAGATPVAIRHLVRRGLLRRATRDVFVVPGSPPTWHRKLWVALLDRSPGAGDIPAAVVARRAAAALHRLPGFDRTYVDVLTHERRSRHPPARRRANSAASSWIPPSHVQTVEGLRCTTLARTVFDLAGLSSPDRLRSGRPYVHEGKVARTLDTALGRGLDIAAVVDVVATLGTRGRPGTSLMRRLLDERGGGYIATESELEDLLLRVLTERGLPLPERQAALGDGTNLIGRVDFFYRATGLILEADSRRHHTALADWSRDRWRDARFAAAGLRVIRVTWHDLVDRPDDVAATVARALHHGAAA
jgi:very-short-patch-repair endonuclease